MPELKSPRKFQILRLIGGRAILSEDLSREIGIKRSLVAKLLHSYWEEGLLKRERIGGKGGPYQYILSNSGKKRLKFFLKNF